MTTEDRVANLEQLSGQLVAGQSQIVSRLQSLEKSEGPVQAVEGAVGKVGAWLSPIWAWSIGWILPVVKKAVPYAGTALLVLLLTGQLSMPGCPKPTPAEVKLSIIPSSATVEVSKSIQFSSAFSDGTNKPMVWDATLGAVDQSGKFTAGKDPGDAIVKADSDKWSAIAKVKIIPSPLPPAPIPVPGLRVMFLLDETKVIPQAQQDIFTSTDIRKWLDEHCVKVNGTPERRWWDVKAVLDKETKVWQDAFARPHPTMPWLLISNGTSGYEGPLPATIDETNKLLQKYAQ